MNSRVTDQDAYEIDNRERYRELLRDSYRKSAPYHYDFHGESASLWECLGWAAFAAIMLGGLAMAILWGVG